MLPKYVVTLVSDSFTDTQKKNIIFNQILSNDRLRNIASISCDIEKRHDVVCISLKDNLSGMLSSICEIMDSLNCKYVCHFSNDHMSGAKIYRELLNSPAAVG
ncbi:hypothetical protein [Petroclostridium sp. X23]|uniref:hypothetical protein n=1 Tax=Petroclostridium sp. X23 TaxID=3045146 RepID=UPI0024ACCB2A|nr:hypothetical protein [Petroclostridium sp. X23]WHH61411.1 hypothetical protein QKW49_12215 [Petroclostridium sp. X23]